MAKHYYNMEIVTEYLLDEEDASNLEDTILQNYSFELGVIRATIEYVDSE